jgi:phosphogluconate dehydratase
MSTAIALSHNMFDAAVYLGICDKIVPGLIIGALTFGHLPAVFVPAGPMPSGIPNDEKSKVRQLYAEGKVGRAELLEAESKSYHSAGTCTFYGTANSNQMLMEIMGLHLPGASFVNPGTPLRDALTREATVRALSLTALGNNYTPVGHIVDEKAIVNGLVGLHATGGSTNHTMHLDRHRRRGRPPGHLGRHERPQRRRPAAGPRLSQRHRRREPLPRRRRHGLPDPELLESGHLHEDVKTVWGAGLSGYTVEAKLIEDKLAFEPAPKVSALPKVLTGSKTPFQESGGLKLLSGNLGVRDQGLGRQARASSHRGAGPGVPQSGRPAGGLQGWRAQWRHDRRGALPGPEGARHARTAQADPATRRPAGSRPQGRAGHRRPHVRRVGQGARPPST